MEETEAKLPELKRIFLCDVKSYLGKPLNDYYTREGTNNEILTVNDWNDPIEIQRQIQSADIIVLDLFRNPHQASFVLANLRPDKFEEGQVKTIIGVSSVMTWNKTNTGPKAKPVKEKEFKSRKTSTKFKGLKLLESLVLNAVKDNVKTYVVAPGILYGNGEEEFANLFKDGWLCEDPYGLVILGEGKNVIPTLHVNDVGVALEALVAKPPEKNPYVVISDGTNLTQSQIIEFISAGIGVGATQNLTPTDDRVLLGNNSANTEVLLAHLQFDPEGSWQAGAELQLTCQGGIGANFERLRNEFVTTRGLIPVRAIVTGPPGSGKTMFSKQLAESFYLPYITMRDMIQEVMERTDEFGEQIRAVMLEPEKKGKPKKPAAKPKKGGKGVWKGEERVRLPIDIITRIVKEKLMSSVCRNKGYIMDGFPKNLEQATDLFKIEPGEGDEAAAAAAAPAEEGIPVSVMVDGNIFPSFVISLECTEEVGRERLKDLPEESIVPEHNDEDGFDRRWLRYEHYSNPEAEIPMNPLIFFKRLEILEIPLEATHNVNSALSAMETYMAGEAKPFNFHPTEQEKEEKRAQEENKAQEEAEEKRLTLEQREAEERQERCHLEQADLARKEKVVADDQELVDTCSLPLRKYLMSNVIPPLVEGLLEVCKAKPDDPIDFLSEYLLKISVSNGEDKTSDSASSSSADNSSSSSSDSSSSDSSSSSIAEE